MTSEENILFENLTPKNIDIKLDKICIESSPESSKLETPFNKENFDPTENMSENKQTIIEKINGLVNCWVSKYKFHTKSIASESEDKSRLFVTEFSDPFEKKPFPEATTKVNKD